VKEGKGPTYKGREGKGGAISKGDRRGAGEEKGNEKSRAMEFTPKVKVSRINTGC